jgi:hypothetical protein
MTPTAPILPDDIAAWLVRPRADRLAALATGGERLRALVEGRSEAELAVPSAAEGWAAVEVIGHLRDLEEFSLVRFRMMLRMADPMLPALGTPDDPAAWGLIEDGAWLFDPERWAADRQYRRDDPHASAAAFARLRAQTLAFLGCLTDAQWERGSIHPRFGRLTFDGWTSVLAWHDDNHLAQLTRAMRAAQG